MTPQEKDLITTLLARLKSAGGQQKDPEADALIRQALTEQPDAPYYLVQTVLIQDLALHNAQNQIAQLEQQVAGAQQAVSKPTSFLGGLFGHSDQPPPPPPGSVPPAGPWTRSNQASAPPPPNYGAQPGYAQPGYAAPGAGAMGGMGAGGGGSFLRSAAATAAGVAGGALLFQGISSLFGHGYSSGLLGGGGMMPGLGETVVNNYYGDSGGGWGGGDQDYGSSGGYDPGASQDQDYSGGGDSDFDSGGGDSDFSGGGDVSSC